MHDIPNQLRFLLLLQVLQITASVFLSYQHRETEWLQVIQPILEQVLKLHQQGFMIT